MMTVAISTLLPDVRIDLPGIPEPVLLGSLYDVLREFYWESEAWKYTYDNGLDWTLNTLAVPTPTPGTDTPIKTVVKRVDRIQYSSTGDDWSDVVPFQTRDQLDRCQPDWRTRTGSNPKSWTNANDGGAVITPQTAATVTTALLIRSIIAPVYDAITDTLPDFLYYEHQAAVKDGIRADLMKIPGKDWTDTKMAAFYKTEFDNGVIKAKSRAEASYGQPAQVMSYGGIEGDTAVRRDDDYGRSYRRW